MGFVLSFIKIRYQPLGRQVCLTMPKLVSSYYLSPWSIKSKLSSIASSSSTSSLDLSCLDFKKWITFQIIIFFQTKQITHSINNIFSMEQYTLPKTRAKKLLD